MIYRSAASDDFCCSDYRNVKIPKRFPWGEMPRDFGGDIIERRSRRGKVFYGCSNYPKCDFVSWNKPVNLSCTECGSNCCWKNIPKQRELLQCAECKI
jgi:DNA topoisomerase-1